jgi:hypothetical protein
MINFFLNVIHYEILNLSFFTLTLQTIIINFVPCQIQFNVITFNALSLKN